MSESEWLARQFEQHRPHLRAVAYRMLGSLADADDAVQEIWLRLSRSDVSAVDNLGGWLTTVGARICLDMLRSRKLRREEQADSSISQVKAALANWASPEEETLIADSIGVALLVVLDTLSPAERLAFVLHDAFAMPFDDIARILGRSLPATKKLASRARRRVQGRTAANHSDWARQRRVVEAFLAASRSGDINALLAALDPDVVRRADRNALPPDAEVELQGAHNVARETATNAALAQHARLALVNGSVGLIVVLRRRLRVALSFTVRNDRIVEIAVIADPSRLRTIRVEVLQDA